LSSWLAEISAAHPAAAVLVVQALAQVTSQHGVAGVSVWHEPRSIPAWVADGQKDDIQACRRRFHAFPPHLASSYLTSEEAEKLHEMALQLNAAAFVELTGKKPTAFFYSQPSHTYCNNLTKLSRSIRNKSWILQWCSIPAPL
jgi:hypothetical protein